MDSGRAYKAKYFALSFCASFLLLAAFFYFMMSGTHAGSGEISATPAQTAQALDTYQPDESDALTLLVFGTERVDSVAETFVLLRFDPVRGEVSVAVFPPQTLLTYDGREETLSDAYRFGGAAYTRQALSSYLDIPIDRFARISISGFITAAAAVGTVEFDLAESVTLSDGELTVTLNPGPHLLDGRQVAALIRHPGYDGGEMQRAQITAQLVSAIIDQRIDIVNSTLLDRVFETVINLLDTDITYGDYLNRQPAARQMANNGQAIAHTIELPGVFTEDGQRFVLTDAALAGLTLRFL